MVSITAWSASRRSDVSSLELAELLDRVLQLDSSDIVGRFTSVASVIRRSRPRFHSMSAPARGAAAGGCAPVPARRRVVGEDLRERRDEVADGATGGAAVELGLDDVDARLREPADVGDLGLDLEALLVHRAQLVEALVAEPVEVFGREHHVDAAASRL